MANQSTVTTSLMIDI